MLKKSLHILLVACLLAAILAAPVGAANGKKTDKNNIFAANLSCSAFIDNDNTLWLWGDERIPSKLMEDVVDVALCGDNTTVAMIKSDGSLWTYGNNQWGQLGDGTTEFYKTTPIKIMDNVIDISFGGEHAAAIQADGTLWTWGNNGSGQLGDGTTVDKLTPVKIMDNVVAVSCFSSNTMAIRADGSLWAWGENLHQYLVEDEAHRNLLVPVKVMEDVAAVSGGDYHTAFIKTDGTLWTWGVRGLLGDGTMENRTSPVKIMDDVIAVSCGRDRFSAAIKADGSLWMWGNNSDGQLGDGTTIEKLMPVKIMDDVTEVCCGDYHTLAAKADGSLWAWGYAAYGALGIGADSNAINEYGRPIQTIPAQINLPAISVSVNVGGAFVLWDDAVPFIDENGRTMVPLRAVANAMGLAVDWFETARVAEFSDPYVGGAIDFPIGSTTAYTNWGEPIEMDTAAVIVNDRTYAPIRYLAEFFGYSVGWDGATRTVIIQ